MKVLHLTHTDLQYDNRILKELNAISANKNFQILALGVFLDENAARTNLKFDCRVVNIKLVSNSISFLPRSLRYSLQLFEITSKFFFKAIKHKPKIIHCHDTMVLPLGVILKIILSCTLIYDAHELESNKNGQSKLLSKATLLLEKIAWPHIDYLISVSNSIIKWYCRQLGNKESCLILNSPFIEMKDGLSDFDKNYLRKTFNIPDNHKVFVYIGYLGYGRSIEKLIRVFQDKNVFSHIVFIGYGELEDYIKSSSLTKFNIHWHRPLPHEDVVTIVKSADFGFCLIENVSLSDYYSLPNKLFEYAFAGVKIIASDFPEIKYIVQKYSLGICVEMDESNIKETVINIELSSFPESNDNIKELSWKYQANRLNKLYTDISNKT